MGKAGNLSPLSSRKAEPGKFTMTLRTLLKSALLVSLMPLLLAGCVNNEAYPGKWQAIDTGASPTDCSMLAGTWRDAGEDNDKTPGISLYQTLYGYEYSGDMPDKADHVTLAFTAPDKLSIAVYGAKGQLRATVYDGSTGQFTCKKGKLTIKNQGPMKEALSVGRFWQSLELGRSSNYLVIDDAQSGAGVILILPAVISNNNWYRFQQITAPATTSAAPGY